MAPKLSPLDARIPKWNFDDLVNRCCPICNCPQEEVNYERPDALNVRHCGRCFAFFVSPSPSEEQLLEFYKFYDEKHRRESKIGADELLASYKNADPFSDLRIRELSSYMNFQKSCVLDIGFGTAYFLCQLKKLGAIPFGLDLDPKAIEYAKLLGIENVFQKSLDDYVSETKFDLITLIDLIEHPLKPMELLRRASELLQPGGLMLIWTPNGDSVRFDKSLVAFRVDLEHMQYLTPNACLFLSAELNLRLIHLETLGFPHLKDIEKPFTQTTAHTNSFKKIIKSIPGFSIASGLRHKFFTKQQDDERRGSYHLFLIMQKPCEPALGSVDSR